MSATLSPRTESLLEFLREWFIDNRVGPTCTKVAEHLGVSKHTAGRELRALDAAGLVRYRPTATSNALRLVLTEAAR